MSMTKKEIAEEMLRIARTGQKKRERTPEEVEAIRRHIEARNFMNIVVGHAQQLNRILKGEEAVLALSRKELNFLLLKEVLYFDGMGFKLTPRAVGVLSRHNYAEEKRMRLE